MGDPVEEVVAPAAIERALMVYQQLKPCDQSVLLQARKILTQHIYGLVDKGECDEQRLIVGGLSRLKAVERDHAIRSAQPIPRERRRGGGVQGSTQPTLTQLDHGGLMLSPAWLTKTPLVIAPPSSIPRRLNRFGLLARNIFGR